MPPIDIALTRTINHRARARNHMTTATHSPATKAAHIALLALGALLAALLLQSCLQLLTDATPAGAWRNAALILVNLAVMWWAFGYISRVSRQRQADDEWVRAATISGWDPGIPSARDEANRLGIADDFTLAYFAGLGLQLGVETKDLVPYLAVAITAHHEMGLTATAAANYSALSPGAWPLDDLELIAEDWATTDDSYDDPHG